MAAGYHAGNLSSGGRGWDSGFGQESGERAHAVHQHPGKLSNGLPAPAGHYHHCTASGQLNHGARNLRRIQIHGQREHQRFPPRYGAAQCLWRSLPVRVPESLFQLTRHAPHTARPACQIWRGGQTLGRGTLQPAPGQFETMGDLAELRVQAAQARRVAEIRLAL